jgi:hypothetical protein
MKAYRDLFQWRWKNDHGEEYYLFVFLDASNVDICMELKHAVDLICKNSNGVDAWLLQSKHAVECKSLKDNCSPNLKSMN